MILLALAGCAYTLGRPTVTYAERPEPLVEQPLFAPLPIPFALLLADAFGSATLAWNVPAAVPSVTHGFFEEPAAKSVRFLAPSKKEKKSPEPPLEGIGAMLVAVAPS